MLSSLLVHTDDVTGAKLAARRAYEQDAYLSNIDMIVWRLFTLSLDDAQFTEADALVRRWQQTLSGGSAIRRVQAGSAGHQGDDGGSGARVEARGLRS